MNEETQVKMAVQTAQVYRDFITKPIAVTDDESFGMMIAGVIGAYHTTVGMDDMIEVLESHVLNLKGIQDGVME